MVRFCNFIYFAGVALCGLLMGSYTCTWKCRFYGGETGPHNHLTVWHTVLFLTRARAVSITRQTEPLPPRRRVVIQINHVPLPMMSIL
jgi:hypothetical protein